MDHSSHKIDSYRDSDHKWVTFCQVCSREEENLSAPCPGKFVPLSEDKKFVVETIDSKSEHH